MAIKGALRRIMDAIRVGDNGTVTINPENGKPVRVTTAIEFADGSQMSSAPEEGGGSTGEQLLSTTVFDLNSAAAQTLYTVPAGKRLVFTKLVLRNSTIVHGDFLTLEDGGGAPLNVGDPEFSFADPDYEFSITHFSRANITMSNASTLVRLKLQSGAAGTPGTCKVDLFGYLVDA